MASFSDISIERPVLTWVLSITIILFGVIGFNYLGVREYPSTDNPVITVNTTYIGANAGVIESQITEPLEESLNGIAGIRSLSSVSRDGASAITVEFDLAVDLESAANDVRDRVSRAISRLPADANPPVVAKSEADANPIVFLNIRSQKHDLLALTAIAQDVFKERLQTIIGVSEVRIWGEKRYSMKLELDPARLAAYKLTPLDVRDALNRENVELPSGRIEGNNTELTVKTMGQIATAEAFENLIIKQDAFNKVRLSDVGSAKLYPENERTLLRRDGEPMVGVVLIPQPGSNSIDIADEFYKRVNQIKKDLPDDIQLGIGFDSTIYIRDAIKEVKESVLIAFVLVIVIIFIFLRNWRTTLIPVLAIPISLIGAFFVMYLFNFSINVLTLLAIVLAIGLVVDDAIVVLENIYAKIEQGVSPVEAAKTGTKEIFFAVIATTIALVAVFLPVIFLQGLAGRLFREFGIVIAGAVIISSFVALTLTPMVSSRMLKKTSFQPAFYRFTERMFNILVSAYSERLTILLRKKWLGIGFLISSFLLIFYFSNNIPSELAPLEDRSDLRIVATGPEGATFEYMDNYVKKVYEMANDSVPEAASIITVTAPGFGTQGVNSGFVRLILVPPSQRAQSQQTIAQTMAKRVQQIPDARAFISQQQTIGARNSGLPVQFVIQAPNFEKLKERLPLFVKEASSNPIFSFVDVNLKFNKPEFSIEIDRDKASALGISTLNIAQTLQFALAGQRYGFFEMNGKQYQVIGQLDRQSRNDELDLRSLTVRSATGDIVTLDNLVTLSEVSSSPQLYRFNRFVTATVSADLAPGVKLSEGIAGMEAVAAKVLDASFSTSLTGPSRDFAESADSLQFAFILALILIYLVLAAQFESFRDPIIIMLTVPLALLGALGSLWWFDQTLNIFSQIGIIMLIGLVTKNGILMVEFANQHKKDGLNKFDAIKLAAESRFRPILMTSLSTILGILPIALALGSGAESRVPMGIAVVGGMALGTFLTLFVIPVIYLIVSKENALLKNIA